MAKPDLPSREDFAMRQMRFLFADVEVGPYSEEEVARYLREGYLSLSDLAKDEGETAWSPLRDILASSPLPQAEPGQELPVAPVNSGSEPVPSEQTDKAHLLRVPNRKLVSLSSLARVTDKIPAFGPHNNPVKPE